MVVELKMMILLRVNLNQLRPLKVQSRKKIFISFFMMDMVQHSVLHTQMSMQAKKMS